MIELLVALVIGVVVIGGLLTFIVVSLNQSNTIASRSYVVRQTQTGLNVLTQDLSEAIGSYPVTVSETATTATITFDIPNTAIQTASSAGGGDAAQLVTWTCPFSTSPATTAVGSCTRKVGTGGAIPEMLGIESATYAPVSSSGAAMTLNTTTSAVNPASIGITLYAADISQANSTHVVVVRGLTQPVVLRTSVDLRNFP